MKILNRRKKIRYEKEPPTIISNNKYSENESVIGEFFGKPLYRKMLRFQRNDEMKPSGDALSKTIELDHGIENIADRVYSNIWNYPKSTQVVNMFNASPDNTIYSSLSDYERYGKLDSQILRVVQFSNTTISVAMGKYWSVEASDREFIIELVYTKTTD